MTDDFLQKITLGAVSSTISHKGLQKYQRLFLNWTFVRHIAERFPDGLPCGCDVFEICRFVKLSEFFNLCSVQNLKHGANDMLQEGVKVVELVQTESAYSRAFATVPKVRCFTQVPS